ncbi:MAG: tRNA (guanosine(37)-N1)-methyltransferase TrmD [Actinomycetaceae bacterium]|nr:tRNA (guanosine(37)-N1)-methyltransferase TrmD [Actinomycetaceae bacterium]
MRCDIISVFPEFFDVLNLSLLGKAQERGILTIASHDLRDWTDDPHRTVDDTPAGGGAGMVMRADVWGKAIDEILEQGKNVSDAQQTKTVLAIPTPAGTPLTQARCAQLAKDAQHIIIACGRYEGIDGRVSEYYANAGVEVFEYSLGDYVLNGGEVAAVALIEAVGRLLPGMVGNPHSLVEESHSEAGLLEYPVYTRPVSWRGLDIPDVLLSGNHRESARWRRDKSFERTAAIRPDLLAQLPIDNLDKKDRKKLAGLGYLVSRGANALEPFTIRLATEADIPALCELSARTFPDACPPHLSEGSIAAHIAENFSEERWAEYVTKSEYQCLVCETKDGQLIAYSLCEIPDGDGVAGVENGAPKDADVGGVERRGPLVLLSKFYIDRQWRSSGLSEVLWERTRLVLSKRTADYRLPFVWVGTNEQNKRAQKAYKKFGFEPAGTRHFLVGDESNVDVVFVRPIHVA